MNLIKNKVLCKVWCNKERRHQLHEVIRLSVMNLIVNDCDHPLIIVASIPQIKFRFTLSIMKNTLRKNSFLKALMENILKIMMKDQCSLQEY